MSLYLSTQARTWGAAFWRPVSTEAAWRKPIFNALPNLDISPSAFRTAAQQPLHLTPRAVSLPGSPGLHLHRVGAGAVQRVPCHRRSGAASVV
jgi:hypothetical protein